MMQRRPRRADTAWRPETGATLAELLVVVVIVSILAVTAIPMAETTVQRRAELALREELRLARTAIDRFHADWEAGRFEDGATGVSKAGYPETLAVLVQGMKVELDTGETETRRYLRRLPRNPFAGDEREMSRQWLLNGYEDDPGARRWNGSDVYDLKPRTDREALDGTRIADW